MRSLHRAPEAVPSTGEVFEGVFEAVPEALIATDLDGVVVLMNQAARSLFACDLRECLGAPVESLMVEADRAGFRRHFRGFLAGAAGTGTEIEFRGLSSEGAPIPIDALLGRVAVSGRPHVLLAVREVSDRVATQQGLERRLAIEALAGRISGRLNTSTLDAIDDAIHDSLGELGRFAKADRTYICQFSGDGRDLDISHLWLVHDGAAPVVGLSSRDDLPWLTRQICEARIVEMPSTVNIPAEATSDRDRLTRCGIGSFIAVPVIAGGQAIGFIGMDTMGGFMLEWRSEELSSLMVIQDFFANALRRKRVSEELQRSNRMLQAVTECNDALIRAEEEEGLLQDLCRIVVEAGGYRLAWVGIGLDDAERSVRPIATWGHDDGFVGSLDLTWADSERGKGPASAAIRAGRPVIVQDIAIDPTYRSQAKARARGYASVISVPFSYADATRGALTVYAADVAAFDTPEVETLQRFADDLAFGIAALRTRERQREAEEQLREMLRSKDEFIATIAHEIRTPLTAVLGFVQLLRDDGSRYEPDERADMLRMVAEQGSDLTNIVDDLLVIAKAEAGRLTVARVAVDLRAQVSQVLETCGLTPGDVIDVGDEPVRAIGDPARVRQVIRNLVTNARRYGGSGLRVVVEADETWSRVSVRDDGPGVDAEEADAIFEPYRRAHNAPGVTASMGLGLTISRKLGRLMGGDVHYRRDAGETVFTLSLPRVG